MINNNRQAGRRRGRNNNNPRQGGGGNNGRGGADSGNRIDSRARGNAAQLLEKYRNLARDSQMSGDRVNTEYYLQFADHYFRVLADNRARQEEQNPHLRRQREEAEAAAAEDAEYDPASFDDGFGNRPEFIARPEQNFRPERAEQGYRQDREGRDRSEGYRQDRPDRQDGRHEQRPHSERQDEPSERQDRDMVEPREDRQRDDYRRPQRDDRMFERTERAEQAAVPTEADTPAEDAPRRRGRQRRDAPATEGTLGLDAAILPPSIVQPDYEEAADPEPPKRRGRPPRPAAEAAE